MTNDDIALLRQYAETESEQAFSRLVDRHINLVYTAALRQVNDPHLAQDVAQVVFAILARKARSISPETILSGWLYRTAHFAAADLLKKQRRREFREQEAQMQSLNEQGQSDSVWQQLSPLLDLAMAGLGDRDRDALILRYFENKSLLEVGTALGVNEGTAQKRVARSLDKLRKFFARRGMSVSATVIAGAISAHSIQAAPVGLGISVAAAGTVATQSSGTVALTKGALKLMAWTKAKTAILVVVAGLITSGTTARLIYLYQHRNSWQDEFNATYKLGDKESIRYIPLPFVEARTTYYRTEERLRTQAEAVSRPPDYFVFSQTNSASPHWVQYGFTSKPISLEDVLVEVLKLKRAEFEAPAGVLELELPGDWTIREGVSCEVLLAELTRFLYAKTKAKWHFTKARVERDVIVARGRVTAVDYNGTIDLYAEHPNEITDIQGSGYVPDLVLALGNLLNLYSVSEVDTDGTYFNLSWKRQRDANYLKMGARREELTDMVLKNAAAQTGLTFTLEKRKVDVWFVTKDE